MHADVASHNGVLFLAPLVCHLLCFQEYNTTLTPSNQLHLILTPLTKIQKETLVYLLLPAWNFANLAMILLFIMCFFIIFYVQKIFLQYFSAAV